MFSIMFRVCLSVRKSSEIGPGGPAHMYVCTVMF